MTGGRRYGGQSARVGQGEANSDLGELGQAARVSGHANPSKDQCSLAKIEQSTKQVCLYAEMLGTVGLVLVAILALAGHPPKHAINAHARAGAAATSSLGLQDWCLLRLKGACL